MRRRSLFTLCSRTSFSIGTFSSHSSSLTHSPTPTTIFPGLFLAFLCPFSAPGGWCLWTELPRVSCLLAFNWVCQWGASCRLKGRSIVCNSVPVLVSLPDYCGSGSGSDWVSLWTKFLCGGSSFTVPDLSDLWQLCSLSLLHWAQLCAVTKLWVLRYPLLISLT